MSLQSKVFKHGSLSSDVFKYYALELTLTENSVSQDKNTSEVAYTLKLKTGAKNQFTGVFNCSLKLNGTTVASAKKQQEFVYNKSYTLLSGTATVTHGADGSLNMPIAVVVDTAETNPYSPNDTTINWQWALTKIPRASTITAVEPVTLGNAFDVKWTPNSVSFRYKLTFSIEDWADTTDIIHPNRTSEYIHAGPALPLELAEKITDSSEGEMKVTLTTYADSECQNIIGDNSKTFKVIVPDNTDTQPIVEMILTADSKLEGVYVQGQSRVRATLNAQPQLGAEIVSYGIRAEGVEYTGSECLINSLMTPGIKEITGYAKDTRGITGYKTEEIEVFPYYIPKLHASAYRCTSDGQAANDGQYLKIEATRDYAPVIVGGTQRNFCKIQFQYKAETEEKYSDPETILSETATVDKITTKALTNAAFNKDTAYTVLIIAEDRVGQQTTVTVRIASEYVFRHKRAGGKGMGLGGYCEEDNLLDVYWNLRVRGNLEIGGKSFLDRIYPVGSIYMSVTECNPTSLFGGTWVQLKDRFLLGAGDIYAGGDTDGEAAVKLTIDKIPSHTHKPTTTVSPDAAYPDYMFQTITDLGSEYTAREKVASGSDYYVNTATAENYNNISAVKQTAATGGGEAHNNMPPYLTVYMYKRTA